MAFILERALGLGDDLIVRVLANELTRQIWLDQSTEDGDRSFRIRAFQFRIGIRDKRSPGIEWAPLEALDDENPEKVIEDALREHGLELENCTWDDIVAVAS